VVGPARPRTQHDYHHDTKVKPEAATAVVGLLMTGGRTPETCWAVNKRQDNKLKNCCIWLVIYLNWTESIWFLVGIRKRCLRNTKGCPPSSWSARPRRQHDCHHDTKVKPEAATAVFELLMMGGKAPGTCWAVNKRQDNKLENCCIWLVIYLNKDTSCYVEYIR